MATILRWQALLLAAAAMVGGPARADGACALPEQPGGPHYLGERQQRIAQLEALPEACLKTMVVQCSAAASEQMLDAGDAASCSMSYEALLRRGFAGDFRAMLAWWRSQGSAARTP